jgi:hypothetical protein
MKRTIRKLRWPVGFLVILAVGLSAVTIVFASAMDELYTGLDLENLQVAKPSYVPGEQPVFTYELVNRSGDGLSIPLNEDFSAPFYLVGIRQHWIERLGANSIIAGIPSTTRRSGARYAAGGTIIFTQSAFPSHIWPSSASLPFTQSLVHSTSTFPAGQYRFYVEYKKLFSDGGAVLQTVSVDFEIATNVNIDIKPGSDANPVNVKSAGLIPVAILGSDSFDVTAVDVTTLAFGPSGAPAAHNLSDSATYDDHLNDVNSDGFADLVSHFRQMETGIAGGDSQTCLSANLLSGATIAGCDAISVK